MKLTTKGDLVIAALRKVAIASNASLTDVEPQSVADGLEDLELMMAEWDLGDNRRGINIGYHFATAGVDPLPDDTHTLPDFSLNAVICNLAIRLTPDYGIDPPAGLVAKARYGKEMLVKSLAIKRAPHPRYPSRMPIGSGNLLPTLNGVTYFHDRGPDHADDADAAD
ncbi:packaged DNA stabilization gp4 family protein [Serratia marcescens]|uniref:Recombinase RmuC n=1 Tax=Serratia marcescens TaxID=615 RepID=A0A9X8YMI2_SERMA|nr:packaged DNA stabilization gp4 family protein [Serratia marcescens]MBS3894728.1 recombinase RmuC [Serratia marcescens]